MPLLRSARAAIAAFVVAWAMTNAGLARDLAVVTNQSSDGVSVVDGPRAFGSFIASIADQ